MQATIRRYRPGLTTLMPDNPDASVEHLAGVANHRVNFTRRQATVERRHRVAPVEDERSLVGRVGVLLEDSAVGELRPGTTTTIGTMTVRAPTLIDVTPEHQFSVERPTWTDRHLRHIAGTGNGQPHHDTEHSKE